MVRRPWFPLTLQLAGKKIKLGHAARRMHFIVHDLADLKDRMVDAEARVMIVAGIALMPLVPLGIDGALIEALIGELSPDRGMEVA